MEPAESGSTWNWRHGDGVPQTAGVMGNRRSHVYHKPNCRGAAEMNEKNRIEFVSEAEAEKAGYRRRRRLSITMSCASNANLR